MTGVAGTDDAEALSPGVRPQSYKLRLNIDPQCLEFSGHVQIKFVFAAFTALFVR